MALTLTIADNAATPTGIVATIAGSDAGSTNTLYTQTPQQTSWTAQGSRTGDGTLSLALPAGYFNAHCFSTAVGGNPAVSSVSSLFAVTTGTQSVLERILLAVAAGIQNIAPASLPGLPANNVYAQLVPNETLVRLPCVVVSPNDRDPMIGGLTGRDDYGKPVVVTIMDRHDVLAGDTTPPTKLNRYLLWRERIIRKFVSQHLQGVIEAYTCTLEPAPVIDPQVRDYQICWSAFTLRFKTREPRGV